MSLSPFDIKGKGRIKTNTLSPFDIKGNGRIKTNTLTPFSPHVEEAFCRSDVYWSDQAPPDFMLNLQTYF